MTIKSSLFATLATGLLLLAGWPRSAQADVIYEAQGDNHNQIGFSGNPGGLHGAFGVGNTITFAETPEFGALTVTLFGYAGGGSVPIEVDLYSGSDPNAGSLLGTEQVVPTGNGYTTESLDFGSLQLPQTLTYIVSIAGNTGSYDDSFVDWQQFTGVAGAPNIGASGDMWYGTPGNFVVDNSFAEDNGAKSNTLGVEFYVPEPGSIAMLGMALLGLGVIRRRRKAM